MSTLDNMRKRFFRVNVGLSPLIPILVVAFTVKGFAFESKSDNIRQVLRQQKLTSAVICDKPLPGGLKRHDIFIAPSLAESNNLSYPEAVESIIVQSLVWIEQNKRDKKVFTILIPGLMDDSSPEPSGSQPASQENFTPLGGIILYKEKENKEK